MPFRSLRTLVEGLMVSDDVRHSLNDERAERGNLQNREQFRALVDIAIDSTSENTRSTGLLGPEDDEAFIAAIRAKLRQSDQD